MTGHLVRGVTQAGSILLLSVWLTGVATAVEPTSVHHGRLADFLGGEGSGVTLDAAGVLRLGPTLASGPEIDAQRVWSMTAAGDRAYIGSGDEGLVHVLEAGSLRQLLKIPAGAPMATLAAGDALFIGTGPGGALWRHDPTHGLQELLVTPSQYVWDLAHDVDGILLACGAEARVLRWHRGGAVDTLMHSPTDGHVRTLARRGDHWLAGTSATAGDGDATGKGRVYELSEDGNPRLLLESEYEEVTQLVVVDSVTYIAAMTVPAQGQPALALLRLNGDGASYPVWRSAGIWAGMFRDGDDIVAVTREPTRILRLAADGESAAILARTDSISPSAALFYKGRLLLGDSQSGALWVMGRKPARKGWFESAVHDAGTVASWGILSWEGSGQISAETRSGNSGDADQSWSQWSSVRGSGQRIVSPPARYLQYRLTLEGDTDRATMVDRVTFRLRQANLPPRIDEVVTFPYRGDAGGLQNPDQIPLPGQQRTNGNGTLQRKSLRVLRWKAADPNGDPLRYSIYVRGSGQKQWKLIEDGIQATKTAVWDTELMPEGVTQLKLIASDAAANPAGSALQDSYVTQPFTIDNTPPGLKLRQRREGDDILIEAELTDVVSALAGARFSVDYDDTTTRLGAADGLFDTSMERVRFTLPVLAAGEHVISVQAWDELENIGVSQIVIEIAP